jgi:hydrogenase-4 component B
VGVTLTEAALLAGMGLIAAGTLLATISRVPRGLAAQIAGAALLVGGAVALVADGGTVGAAFSGEVQPRFGLDGLSAFFLVVIAAGAIPPLLSARDSLAGSSVRRPLDTLTGAFVLSLAGVVAARDPSTFLAFWELMTLIPAAAILYARRNAAVRHAVFVYLAITHIGGAGVWIAILTLAREHAFGGQLEAGGPQALVLVSALIGFGTKAGLMPLHTWLPRAHPVAPSHVSAVMSGVMLKVALYGLIRVTFEWAAPAPRWLGFTLLAVGALSAVGGVLYAIVQRELKRLLAFSSIDNVGIVVLALGAAVLLGSDHHPLLSALAFAAALLHVANHAAFKGLLFVAAGAFGDEIGRLELDQLGGLLRRMPWTGAAFLVGCGAIAGVPPLNGFASEWLTLQSLLHAGFSDTAGIAVAGALGTVALGASAALAVFCFVKVAGLVLLGAPRSEAARTATERPLATRAALTLSAGLCVALAATAGLLVPALVHLAPGHPRPDAGAGITVPGSGGLPALALVMGVVALTALVRRLTGAVARSQPAPAWASGQPIEPSLAWTSAGFTKPLRLVLEALLRPRREFGIAEGAGGAVARISYHAEVPHLFDSLLYGPAHRAAQRGAAFARRLQSGSLRTYVAYLLVLVLGLLAFVRFGGFG